MIAQQPFHLTDIKIGAAIGALMVALSRFASGRTDYELESKRCTWTVSIPWQYMIGCTDIPILSRRLVGPFGREEIQRACPQCAAMKAASQASRPNQWGKTVLSIQDERGMKSYRYPEVPDSWLRERSAARLRRKRTFVTRRMNSTH